MTEYTYCTKCLCLDGLQHTNETAKRCAKDYRMQCAEFWFTEVTDDSPQEVHMNIALHQMGVER